ncbi:hypothetical protein Pelo_15959 [Pelomyxa schiedti]|nr:hypothetical protein Pelo_15959 [Pelomyxa schiedti]
MQPDSDHPHPVIGAVAAHAVAAIATAAVTVVEEVTGSKIAMGRPCQTEAIFLRDIELGDLDWFASPQFDVVPRLAKLHCRGFHRRHGCVGRGLRRQVQQGREPG